MGRAGPRRRERGARLARLGGPKARRPEVNDRARRAWARQARPAPWLARWDGDSSLPSRSHSVVLCLSRTVCEAAPAHTCRGVLALRLAVGSRARFKAGPPAPRCPALSRFGRAVTSAVLSGQMARGRGREWNGPSRGSSPNSAPGSAEEAPSPYTKLGNKLDCGRCVQGLVQSTKHT